MAEEAAWLEPGALFAGDYRVVRSLAEGGMGEVYVVDQLSTGKARALKLMRPEIARDADSRRRFELEARVGARIESDHVVEIHSAGVDGGTPYIVMELLDGEDLAARVDSVGALEATEVRDIFEQLCHAVGAAHAAGIVHRDLKPANVFLARTKRAGDDQRTNVKVLDFGIAKLVADAQTLAGNLGGMSTSRSGMMVGTPLWMAPEQTERVKITPAADVWSLGLILYYLLTGRSYWLAAADPNAAITKILKEVVMGPLPPASARAQAQGVAGGIASEVDAVLARCLVREPANRFRDAHQLWIALGSALAQPSSPALRGAAAAAHVGAHDKTVADRPSLPNSGNVTALMPGAPPRPSLAGPIPSARDSTRRLEPQPIVHTPAPSRSWNTRMLFIPVVVLMMIATWLALRH